MTLRSGEQLPGLAEPGVAVGSGSGPDFTDGEQVYPGVHPVAETSGQLCSEPGRDGHQVPTL